jgi:ketosteroid isomerase-like protein
MNEGAKQFCERYFARLYGARDLSVIDELREPDAGAKGLAANGAYRELCARVLATFDAIEMKIDRVVESGDEAMLFMRFCATTRDGKRVEMRGSSYVRIAGAKLRDSDNVWDIAGLFASLGEPIDAITTVADAIERVANNHGAK